MISNSTYVGQPTSRVDGPLKVTGAAKYAAEYKRDVVRVFVRRGLARAAELAGGTAAA